MGVRQVQPAVEDNLSDVEGEASNLQDCFF